MRILLIRPPKTKKMNPMGFPLGLMSLASFLKGEHEVRVIDYNILDYSKKELKNYVTRFKPELIGLTGINMQKGILKRISSFLKGFNKTPILVGGPYATCEREELLENKNIDYVVVGEGEITLLELVKCLESKKPLNKVKGLIYKDKDKIIFAGERELCFNIDRFRMDYGVVNIENYFSSNTASRLSTSSKRHMQLMTSRGCPFTCIFCSKIFGNKFRARSFKSIAEEINELVTKYKIEELIIEDENFLLDKKRAMRILDYIIKKKFNIKLQFPNGLHVNTLDEEIVKKLKDAGAHYISLGIESGSKRIQKLICKNLDLNVVKTVVNLLNKYQIKANGLFMICFPFERKKDIYETIRYASSLKLNSADFAPVITLKGTKLYKLYKKNRFSKREIKMLRLGAYLFFYFKDFRFLKAPFLFKKLWTFLKNF